MPIDLQQDLPGDIEVEGQNRPAKDSGHRQAVMHVVIEEEGEQLACLRGDDEPRLGGAHLMRNLELASMVGAEIPRRHVRGRVQRRMRVIHRLAAPRIPSTSPFDPEVETWAMEVQSVVCGRIVDKAGDDQVLGVLDTAVT